MADNPPANPGTMTPESKAGLGSRLDLAGAPAPLAGADVVPDGDLSTANAGEMSSGLDDAYSDYGGFRAEARDVILASPAGSVATEGYHLAEQSAAINDQGHLDVGPVPARPPQERV